MRLNVVLDTTRGSADSSRPRRPWEAKQSKAIGDYCGGEPPFVSAKLMLGMRKAVVMEIAAIEANCFAKTLGFRLRRHPRSARGDRSGRAKGGDIARSLMSIIYESAGVRTRISFAGPPCARLGDEAVEPAMTRPQAATPATSSSHGQSSALTATL